MGIPDGFNDNQSWVHMLYGDGQSHWLLGGQAEAYDAFLLTKFPTIEGQELKVNFPGLDTAGAPIVRWGLRYWSKTKGKWQQIVEGEYNERNWSPRLGTPGCFGPFSVDNCGPCDNYNAKLQDHPFDKTHAIKNLVFTAPSTLLVGNDFTIRKFTQASVDRWATNGRYDALHRNYPDRFPEPTSDIFIRDPDISPILNISYFSQFNGFPPYNAPNPPDLNARPNFGGQSVFFGGQVYNFDNTGFAQSGYVNMQWEEDYPILRGDSDQDDGWYIAGYYVYIGLCAAVGNSGYRGTDGYRHVAGNPGDADFYTKPSNWQLFKGGVQGGGACAKPYAPNPQIPGQPNYFLMQNFLPVFNGNKTLTLEPDATSFTGNLFEVAGPSRVPVALPASGVDGKWAIGGCVQVQAVYVFHAKGEPAECISTQTVTQACSFFQRSAAQPYYTEENDQQFPTAQLADCGFDPWVNPFFDDDLPSAPALTYKGRYLTIPGPAPLHAPIYLTMP